LPLSGKVVLH
jgi:hypothetical protein